MAASLNEPFLVADAFVALHKDLYHMWYIYGTKWEKFAETDPPDRVYKIAQATSEDGINWQRDGRKIIGDRLGADECQALPTVFHRGGMFHMYFCYRQAHGFRKQSSNAYRLGYAYSNDMVDWERDDSKAGMDRCFRRRMGFQLCNVIRTFSVPEKKIYMLYNGNEFGKFGVQHCSVG